MQILVWGRNKTANYITSGQGNTSPVKHSLLEGLLVVGPSTVGTSIC